MNSFSSVVVSAYRRAAFTLVELLVTMAVGVLLVVFLFQLLNSTIGAWRNGEDQNDTYREARAAMQLMVRDVSQISGALPRNPLTPTPTPVSAQLAPSGLAPVLVLDHYDPAPDVADPSPQPGDEINEELYCLTNIPNNGVSSLCAVGYFCMWMPDLVPDGDPNVTQKRNAAPKAYGLVRQFLGSGSATTPGLYDRFFAKKDTLVLAFSDVYKRARPPLIPASSKSPPPSAAGTLLASYIWDLQFRTSDTLQKTSPAPVPAYDSTPPYQETLPAFVEIRFKALSARAARQLEGNGGVGRTTWNDNSAATNGVYKKIILPGTRQFVARVPIYSGSAKPTPTP